MFKNIFKKLTYDNTTAGNMCATLSIMVFAVACITGTIILLKHAYGNTLSTPYIDSIFIITMFPAVIATFIIILDKGMEVFIDFIHEGDMKCNDFINTKLYGTPRGGYWGGHERGMAFAITVTMSFLPLLAFWLCFHMPVLFIIALSISAIIGVIYGLAWVTRFAVRINKKFKKHSNDPNAHKET